MSPTRAHTGAHKRTSTFHLILGTKDSVIPWIRVFRRLAPRLSQPQLAILCSKDHGVCAELRSEQFWQWGFGVKCLLKYLFKRLEASELLMWARMSKGLNNPLRPRILYLWCWFWQDMPQKLEYRKHFHVPWWRCGGLNDNPYANWKAKSWEYCKAMALRHEHIQHEASFCEGLSRIISGDSMLDRRWLSIVLWILDTIESKTEIEPQAKISSQAALLLWYYKVLNNFLCLPWVIPLPVRSCQHLS